MTLRELMIERILFSVTEQELRRDYQLSEDELTELTDLDLFDLYETVSFEAQQ